MSELKIAAIETMPPIEPTPPAEMVVPSREERRSGQRILMLRLSYISYCIDSALLFAFWAVGAVSLEAGFLDLAGGSLVCGITYLVFRLGLQDSFKDPYLAAPSCVASSSVQLCIAFVAPSVGVLVVTVIFNVFAFAALRLRKPELLALWLAVSTAIIALLAFSPAPLGLPHATPAQSALSGIWISLVLGRCAYIGLYGASVRKQLGLRNRELAEAQGRLEELARNDSLTGTLNRRTIFNLLAVSLQLSADKATSVGVILADLDNFKTINDQHGHLTGDKVLRRFSETAAKTLRGTDQLGRYGGEEFIVVLPSVTDSTMAANVAERIRAAVAADDWEAIAHGLRVTVSLGVACQMPNETAEDVIRRADEALYIAKASGRNVVRQA